jgi:hypothetical protein
MEGWVFRVVVVLLLRLLTLSLSLSLVSSSPALSADGTAGVRRKPAVSLVRRSPKTI